MHSQRHFAILSASIALSAALLPLQAFAQTAPPGAIFDLATTHPAPLTTYTQFNTSFVASSSAEYVSFVFREQPAYFSFDDACVSASSCSSSNLLTDPGFEASSGVVGSNFPVGWNRFIQAVDTSAIGEVAGNAPGQGYGCGANAHGGSIFWCDGSVQGYDGLDQYLTGLTVGSTYNISFYLDDNSGSAPVVPNIDMLVYAGTELPTGSIPIGVTPEPSTFVLLGTGLVSAAGVVRRRIRL